MPFQRIKDGKIIEQRGTDLEPLLVEETPELPVLTDVQDWRDRKRFVSTESPEPDAGE